MNTEDKKEILRKIRESIDKKAYFIQPNTITFEVRYDFLNKFRFLINVINNTLFTHDYFFHFLHYSGAPIDSKLCKFFQEVHGKLLRILGIDIKFSKEMSSLIKKQQEKEKLEKELGELNGN